MAWYNAGGDESMTECRTGPVDMAPRPGRGMTDRYGLVLVTILVGLVIMVSLMAFVMLQDVINPIIPWALLK